MLAGVPGIFFGVKGRTIPINQATCTMGSFLGSLPDFLPRDERTFLVSRKSERERERDSEEGSDSDFVSA